MRPFLKQGEKILVAKVCAKDLKRGDLVLYSDAGNTVCHRLVKKSISTEGALLHVRGDASTEPPEKIKEDALVGRVVGIVRNGKIIATESLPRRIMQKLSLFSAPLLAKSLRLAGKLKKTCASR